MKLKNNQSGVAHLAAILAVVVVVTIGVVGWKVWDSKKQNDNKTTTSSIPTSSAKPKPTKTSTVSGKNTIKLPKMGIQFEVPDSLKTLAYVEDTSTADKNIKTGFGSEAYPLASIVLPNLETPDCKLPEKAGGYLGVIWKVSGQYPKDATVENSEGILVKQFSSYYISYRVPSDNCSSDAAQQTKIESVQDELKTSLSTATEIK